MCSLFVECMDLLVASALDRNICEDRYNMYVDVLCTAPREPRELHYAENSYLFMFLQTFLPPPPPPLQVCGDMTNKQYRY